MAYRFKISESPQHALRRVGLDQINRAAKALAKSTDQNHAIHETRKCLKRIRALLRLVRPGLDDDVFQVENQRYRGLGRMLSPARDAHVLSVTLLTLEPFADGEAALAIADLKTRLASSGLATPLSAEIIETAREQLQAAKLAMAELTVGGRGLTPVEHGLRDCYRMGVRRLERAYRSGSDEAFHDWRKSVQLHWRHMALLSRAWPDMFAARVEAARRLSQLLGESQDLSVLATYLDTHAKESANDAGARSLLCLTRNRQGMLLDAARPRGELLFSSSPKALAHCVTNCWQAARKIEELPEPAPAAGALPGTNGQTSHMAEDSALPLPKPTTISQS